MWCDSTAGPRSLASSGSSFHELYLSYKVRTAPNLPRMSPCRAPSLGFPSPSRHQLEESTLERDSQVSPCRSALSVSHAHDVFLLFEPCGFISPRYHVRDSPFRGSLPPPSRLTSSVSCALLSFDDSFLPPSCLVGAGSSRPAFRALLRAAVRSHRQGD
jgi:hypothetical protein